MEDDPLIVRMGTFFIVMGLGIFILFVASDLAEKPEFDYLFIAMLLIGIGWTFRRKKAPPPSADRFSYFRRMRTRKKADKTKGKQEEKK
jgi:hypothetical protein